MNFHFNDCRLIYALRNFQFLIFRRFPGLCVSISLPASLVSFVVRLFFNQRFGFKLSFSFRSFSSIFYLSFIFCFKFLLETPYDDDISRFPTAECETFFFCLARKWRTRIFTDEQTPPTRARWCAHSKMRNSWRCSLSSKRFIDGTCFTEGTCRERSENCISTAANMRAKQRENEGKWKSVCRL